MSGGPDRRSATYWAPSPRGLDVRVFEDPLLLAEQLASDICDQIIETLAISPRLVLTASGGRSYSLTYQFLRERHGQRLDWTRVVAVQMDEYLGFGRNDFGSMAHQLERELVRPLGIGDFVTFFDADGACAHDPSSYDLVVAQLGGLDLALHGIGVNGHIGFNEPGSPRDGVTRVVELAEETRRANFADVERAPTHGVTLGLATLGNARRSFLAAMGLAKSAPIARLLSGEAHPTLPASIILEGPSNRLYLDRLAYHHETRPGPPAPADIGA